MGKPICRPDCHPGDSMSMPRLPLWFEVIFPFHAIRTQHLSEPRMGIMLIQDILKDTCGRADLLEERDCLAASVFEQQLAW